jgi:hypothetical protein
LLARVLARDERFDEALAVIEAGKSTDEYAASLGGISTEYKQIGDATVKAIRRLETQLCRRAG